MIEKIQIYISIIAAVAITIASIINHATLYDLVFRLIIVIILFYFFGLIVKYYLIKNVFPPEEEPVNPEELSSDVDVSMTNAAAELNDIDEAGRSGADNF